MRYIDFKWLMMRWGFQAIQNAIYFRFNLDDNIDRCAFFCELNCGWYDMYGDDEYYKFVQRSASNLSTFLGNL